MLAEAPLTAGPKLRPRLLIVNSTLHIGGAEQVAASLARNVSRERFEVSACYLKQAGRVADQMLRTGVDLVPIPGLSQGRRDYLTFLKLRRLIRTRRIDVVHTHDLHGLIDGVACKLTTPGLKLVHTFHYGNYPVRKLRHKLIELISSRVADALVAVSHTQCAAIRRLYRIPGRRIRVIWNGVEEPSLAPCNSTVLESLTPGTPIIASVSTLIPQKGLDFLLEAAAILKGTGERFILIIAGDGRLRESLVQKADRLGLGDQVRFLGWVSDASNTILPRCDIFVQSSLWEAMSMVVLEAMAAGKPLVATRVGENPRVIVEGRTGLIVPPADANALARALRALLRDASLRREMGRAGRQRFGDCFTVHHMVKAHEQLYRQLASAP
jgi:glycosyltransferase involved in cell wall biosynthesis